MKAATPLRAPPKKPREPALRMPWQFPAMEPRELNPAIFAVQALQRGEANAGQQQRALAFIIELTDERRMSFYPGAEDGRRASDFAEGKRWVGSQLLRLLKLRPRATETAQPREPAVEGSAAS